MSVNVRSLGVILYEICELKRAFEGKNLMSVMMRIIQGKLPALSPERGQLGPIFNKLVTYNTNTAIILSIIKVTIVGYPIQ